MTCSRRSMKSTTRTDVVEPVEPCRVRLKSPSAEAPEERSRRLTAIRTTAGRGRWCSAARSPSPNAAAPSRPWPHGLRPPRALSPYVSPPCIHSDFEIVERWPRMAGIYHIAQIEVTASGLVFEDVAADRSDRNGGERAGCARHRAQRIQPSAERCPMSMSVCWMRVGSEVYARIAGLNSLPLEPHQEVRFRGGVAGCSADGARPRAEFRIRERAQWWGESRVRRQPHLTPSLMASRPPPIDARISLAVLCRS